MSSSKEPDTPGNRNGDYEVGYKRPPVAFRFREGDINNPKGRPKKQKTVSTILQQMMLKRIKFVDENGRTRTMALQEVIISSLFRNAARGDLKAIQAAFSLLERYRESPATTLDSADLSPEDQRIVDDYFVELLQGSAQDKENPAAAGKPDDEQVPQGNGP